MICAKGGGLASSNEIFTVGCSIVGIAFEFLISPNEDNSTFQNVFMENVGCLSDFSVGTLEQVILLWFE